MLHFVLRSLQPVVVLMCVSSVLCYDLLVLLPCVASRHRQHRHRQPLILWCPLSNSRYMSVALHVQQSLILCRQSLHVSCVFLVLASCGRLAQRSCELKGRSQQIFRCMRLGATDPMRAARVVLFTSSLDGPAHLPDSVQHWHHFVILLDEIHTWPQAASQHHDHQRLVARCGFRPEV